MPNSFDVDTGKVFTDVAITLTKDAVIGAWNKVKSFFKDLDAESAIQYGTAYTLYLENTKDKNGKVKTLIYRRMPKDLYSFYECIGVDFNGETIDTSSIENLLDISGRIIVTGSGGVGKTILLKHLFLNTIETTGYIPVLVELRKFNALDAKEISLYNTVFQSLHENGFELEEKYFESSLKEGGYVILLDGFDEINREKIDRMTSEIKRFCDKYHENKFIISSRPTDWFIGWNDFSEMSTLPLTKEQALSLIKKLDFDEPVKETFYAALKESLYDKYTSFASNPLLLTIMLLTFNNHASIPDKLNDFYEEAFSTLYNTHDATKDCYVRDIRTRLGCEDFKTVFSYICFKTYFAGEFEFSESKLREHIQAAKKKFSTLQFSVDDFQEDLILSVCMLVKDGLNYRFTHRSFQEYFAAWYTCKETDDNQKKLLTAWLSESDAAVKDEYLTMLFNLQSEKVNKIVFCPGIKRIQSLYERLGFSIELLYEIFEGIIIKPYKSKDHTQRYRIALAIKDRYLCNILQMTCRLNKYSYSKVPNDHDDELSHKILSTTKGKYKRAWSFDDVLRIISVQELLDCLSWFERQYMFCFEILRQNTDNSIARKKRVSSIIEEL